MLNANLAVKVDIQQIRIDMKATRLATKADLAKVHASVDALTERL